MPDTRPGLIFKNGICAACINYKKQKTINWQKRKEELKNLCKKYQNSNDNGYDCAIAVSGGKDSHFQVYYIKEVMNMNPVLFSVENVDTTETGKKNLHNLAETFSCDIIEHKLNRTVLRKLMKSAFIDIGAPTWYIDALIYAFPVRMCLNLGIKLLVYGENVNYTYGGKYNEDTPSAMLQPQNDVVKPIHKKWIDKKIVSKKEINSAIQPTIEECKKAKLNPIYLSYFVPWDSHYNFNVAKRWGFHHLGHEYKREGMIEDYNSIDSIGYLINEFLKYPKFAHSSATQMASRWIRSGMVTREEMIPFVKKFDGQLDQGIIDRFCEFTKITIREFWETLDKWYNPKFFKQDSNGVWHEKFEVGKGIKK